MSQRKLQNFESRIIPLQPPKPPNTIGEIVAGFFFLVLVPMLAGCFFLWSVFSNLSLAYRCNEVDGHINNRYGVLKKMFFAPYTITYYYTVDGIQYTGKDSVSEKPTNIAARVFYDPQDPKISQLEFKWKLSLFFGIMFMWVFWSFMSSFKSLFSSHYSPSGNSYR